ncbi:MAG: hypothetical protein ABIR51_00185 [Sphingomicrobium sp.]
MTLYAFLTAMSVWLAALTGPGDTKQLLPVRRVVIQDTLILRIPVRPIPPRLPFEWVERKGPKCLASRTIAGAFLSGPASIDFLMADRTRVRAEIDDDCPAIDFYGGFYLQSNDERICAKRDEIRSRMGGSCRIERFRTLEAKVKR